MITIGVKWINVPNAVNVYCGRGSAFGNPYPMKNKSDAERNRVCDLYEEYFKAEANTLGSELRKSMLSLLDMHNRGIDINLQCFCTPKRCHCETIKRSLENVKYRSKS